MANPTILWGTINADGTIESSSGGFTVTPGDEDGHYAIAFAVPFNTIPSIVGSQIGFGGNENPLDNIVFPKLIMNMQRPLRVMRRAMPEIGPSVSLQ